ncbi:MAG: AsmA family protein, partial [Candidatus Sulfotelmatobacter sp.]
MKRIAFRRRVGAVAVVILLFLFLVRPGAERLKARITNAISRSVQRPADIGSVHIRFLPQPGFDLDNVVVYEDPSFGAEPMLRAPEVTAVVRLTSLLRGKLDISRLELTEPSLNLVRREDGRWNWNMLLERTARSPLAPTAKAKSETRPGFPYIEASSGRINLKIGAEKKSYALLNADFAVWQESENEWGIRLKAEPVRTDMNLSDAGLVRLSGIWQRAGSLRETPLQFNLEWRHAPLGQFTKLFYGNDKGWRGDVQVEAAFSGTPSTLHITTDASVQDFHRYDILVSEGLRLATHCEANYSTVDDIMREIFCLAPVGDGMITLKGNSGSPGSRNADLSLDLENVPANAV